MREYEKIDDINAVSMQMILHAGDGRLMLEKAMEYIGDFDFNEAEKNIQAAEEAIKQAHVSQTDIMQKQISGDNVEYSILFTHAQDTVMTINSELRIAKQMFINQKKLDQRLKFLETKLENKEILL